MGPPVCELFFNGSGKGSRSIRQQSGLEAKGRQILDSHPDHSCNVPPPFCHNYVQSTMGRWLSLSHPVPNFQLAAQSLIPGAFFLSLSNRSELVRFNWLILTEQGGNLLDSIADRIQRTKYCRPRSLLPSQIRPLWLSCSSALLS